jgi:uncharacterized membrane protein HdeD (DUF308 family)
MDTQDTSIRDSRTRPSAAASEAASSSSDYQPEFFGPAGWALNDDMSAALARNWWAVALRGVFAILFGILAVLMPGITLAALVLLFSAYMLVDGIFAIVAAVRAARRHERWGWLVLEGIADLAAGAIAFLWPVVTVVAFIYLLAAWAIVSGALMTAAAFRLHIPHGRGWMLFGGVVSLIWGMLLLIWPLTGALVLTWWLAAYALIFGGALLVLAFRLRARRQDRPSSRQATQGA